MIDNKNIDPSAKFVLVPVVLNVASVAQSQSDIKQAMFRAPYSGQIVSVHAHVVAITDSDDGARLDVKKATTSVLTGAINPTQDTVVAGTVKTDGTEDFIAGDAINVHATTGSGDTLTGISVTIVIRANCGGEAVRPSI